ncbi:tumor protein p53-inducible nuclear protein 2 isoform X2 [Pungitius pungitius]|uniref:tumor protein p53-inducible nuclear protein 2 isoform X2 n=1 Tax=Pungitius pungitius TaxID=134920 RepID=UPI002E0D9A74
MFQRLSNLLFGEVEEVAAELKGPNACVTEADEEGWMLVHLPEAERVTRAQDTIAQSLPDINQPNPPIAPHTRSECPAPHPPHKRRRTHRGRAQGPPLCPSVSPSGATAPVTPPSSTPSTSPGSGSECGGRGGGGRAGPGRGCMDESWFVTPPPCFTAEGATAEASPMEDLLIEHPSMSVYVSPGNLSVVGEEGLGSSMSRVAEPASAPATCSTLPSRASRGAAAQAGALAKVTQVGRVQRGKARIERRHLGRNRIQRQNRTREQQVPRHANHARNTFLHQPSMRNICH